MRRLKVLAVYLVAVVMFAAVASTTALAGDFEDKIAEITATVDEAAALQEAGDRRWRSKVKVAFAELKKLYKRNSTSPDVLMLMARCYMYNDRFQKAKKTIGKAYYYSPDRLDVLITKGDIYSADVARQMKEKKSGMVDFDPSADLRIALGAYQYALDNRDVDKATEALINLKIGDAIAAADDRLRARRYWGLAISIDPESPAADMARDRLGI